MSHHTGDDELDTRRPHGTISVKYKYIPVNGFGVSGCSGVPLEEIVFRHSTSVYYVQVFLYKLNTDPEGPTSEPH